jgi:hypothetical protein
MTMGANQIECTVGKADALPVKLQRLAFVVVANESDGIACDEPSLA